MRLLPPLKVGKLQRALHAKAKQSPSYRFYVLYDKVFRRDVLSHAYRLCRANNGSAGVDAQSFADIEEYGVERWLDELTEELKERTYRPQAVRRVMIPKQDGKQRPLGIPTVRDRVVQTATLLVLEPIFEADLQPEQYAYRPDKSAHGALEKINSLIRSGYREVVDADLSGYFDSIPHVELMKSVARRISDRHMLHLIKMWLVAPVEETDERGNKRRMTRNKDERRVSPQGSPISPLLANLYMRRFLLGWKVLGHERLLQSRIVNYADDFVICCRYGQGAEALATLRLMMKRLKLTVNEEKTHLCRLPEETFDFLGYTFGRLWSRRTGGPYYGMRPSAKAIQKLRRDLHDKTSRHWLWTDMEDRVALLNRTLTGWANYLSVGTVSSTHRAIDAYVFQRIRQWWCAKHKIRNRRDARFSKQYAKTQFGLVRLSDRHHRVA